MKDDTRYSMLDAQRESRIQNPESSINYQMLDKGRLKLVISGKLDSESTSRLWTQALGKVGEIEPQMLVVDAAGVDYCDGAGMALLLQLKAVQSRRAGSHIRIEGLRSEFEQLLKLFDPGKISEPEQAGSSFVRLAESVGQTVAGLLRDFTEQVSFIGELSTKLLDTAILVGRIPSVVFRRSKNDIRHTKYDIRGGLRLRDTLLIAEKAGADAVGITALLGFLIGLILAFQSAIAMRKFGAEIFVADLVTISIFRELGPLLTAFVLASRSGSAFAAELGTMKVNEEIDALTTMGIDPVRFLAIPRVIGAVVVMPLLTVFNNLFGLIGCGLVMMSLGFTPIAVINQIQQAVGLGDLFGGLAKTLVFGMLIAGIGCLRGFQTGTDASAVGDSATRAVVSGIIAIVLADGVFAVAYYFLGI